MLFTSPPRDSPYLDPDIFVDIETDIAFFRNKGAIMLAGDFSARTGKANDFIDVDNCNLIPGDNIPSPFISLPSRQNFDNNINDDGKHLLELCKSCDLRILNGRTKGDSLGKFTYHSSKGVSTVCDPVSGLVQFPATFRKSSFLVKKRIFMRNDSFQTFIDVASFIILSGGF